MKTLMILFTAILLTTPHLRAGENPVEVGTVRWGRDLEEAFNQSSETGRPVLVLFQEVPGCRGCQDFGRTVLSHPLLVEAIEDEFVPVLVYNNRGGKDKKLLQRFGEPAWNYQVVRFLDVDGRDLIPRKDRVWTTGEIAERMMAALKVSKREIPRYLEGVAAENSSNHHAESAFAMPCFWVGEAQLGRIDGVVTTEAGWIDHQEVTRVRYDRKKLTLESLARKARSFNSAQRVFTSEPDTRNLKGYPLGTLDERYRKAKASDQKKQLEGWTALHLVPGLTEMQTTKMNSFLPLGRSEALKWLSPRQREVLRELE